MLIKLNIPVKPIPKARPRASYFGGIARIYTPKRTKDVEQEIAQIARKRLPNEPLRSPVSISMVFCMPIPKSTSLKNRRKLEGTPHVKKTGDIDNLIKTVLDALNGIAWEDDSQVFDVSAKKIHSREPSIELSITYV